MVTLRDFDFYSEENGKPLDSFEKGSVMNGYFL